MNKVFWMLNSNIMIEHRMVADGPQKTGPTVSRIRYFFLFKYKIKLSMIGKKLTFQKSSRDRILDAF